MHTTRMRSVSVIALSLVLFLAVATATTLVRVPGGLLFPRECVHEVASGSTIVENERTGELSVVTPSGEARTLPKCRPVDAPLRAERSSSFTGGWQVWSTFQHPNNDTFTAMTNYWNVPAPPTVWPNADLGILYYFPGLQSDNWVPGVPGKTPPNFDIIQPVLQYGGGSENGGGKFWGLASWYVTLDNGAIYSTLVQVQPGASIFGNMTQHPQSTNCWFIGGTVGGHTSSVNVCRARLAVQPWAYITAEAYDIESCSWFPPKGDVMKFTQIALTDGSGDITPTWTLNHNNAHCNAAISSPSAAEVDISFS